MKIGILFLFLSLFNSGIAQFYVPSSPVVYQPSYYTPQSTQYYSPGATQYYYGSPQYVSVRQPSVVYTQPMQTYQRQFVVPSRPTTYLFQRPATVLQRPAIVYQRPATVYIPQQRANQYYSNQYSNQNTNQYVNSYARPAPAVATGYRTNPSSSYVQPPNGRTGVVWGSGWNGITENKGTEAIFEKENNKETEATFETETTEAPHAHAIFMDRGREGNRKHPLSQDQFVSSHSQVAENMGEKETQRNEGGLESALKGEGFPAGKEREKTAEKTEKIFEDYEEEVKESESSTANPAEIGKFPMSSDNGKKTSDDQKGKMNEMNEDFDIAIAEDEKTKERERVGNGRRDQTLDGAREHGKWRGADSVDYLPIGKDGRVHRVYRSGKH